MHTGQILLGSAAAFPVPPALTQAGPSTQNRRITLHIEVRLVPVSNVRPDSVTGCIRHWLSDNFTSLQIGQEMTEYSMYNILSQRRALRLAPSCEIEFSSRTPLPLRRSYMCG